MLYTVVIGSLGVPFFVITQIPHLNVVLFQIAGFAGQINGQIGLIHLKILLQLAQRNTAQIDMVVIVHGKKMLVAQGRVVVGNGVAELGLVFAVEHQRNAKACGHFGGQLLLPQNKRLERVKQVFGGQSGEQAVGLPVGGTQIVVKPGVDPCLHIVPPPRGVNVRGPCDGEGVHTVFIFQKMGGVKAVLSAAAGH